MTAGIVQECGCIALPEELRRRTGLYPGAVFQFQVAEDGASVTLNSIQRTHQVERPVEPALGAHCGGFPKKQ